MSNFLDETDETDAGVIHDFDNDCLIYTGKDNAEKRRVQASEDIRRVSKGLKPMTAHETYKFMRDKGL